jgi:hypothetical protein
MIDLDPEERRAPIEDLLERRSQNDGHRRDF